MMTIDKNIPIPPVDSILERAIWWCLIGSSGGLLLGLIAGGLFWN